MWDLDPVDDAVTGTLRLLRGARVLVNLDSGIGHLASLSDTPQIVVYPGRGDERRSVILRDSHPVACDLPICTAGSSACACRPGAARCKSSRELTGILLSNATIPHRNRRANRRGHSAFSLTPLADRLTSWEAIAVLWATC